MASKTAIGDRARLNRLITERAALLDYAAPLQAVIVQAQTWEKQNQRTDARRSEGQ
jgi:hypothetical protein